MLILCLHCRTLMPKTETVCLKCGKELEKIPDNPYFKEVVKKKRKRK